MVHISHLKMVGICLDSLQIQEIDIFWISTAFTFSGSGLRPFELMRCPMNLISFFAIGVCLSLVRVHVLDIGPSVLVTFYHGQR